MLKLSKEISHIFKNLQYIQKEKEMMEMKYRIKITFIEARKIMESYMKG